MTESVGHKRNEAVRFGQLIQNRFYQIDVRHLAVAAEVVNCSGFPLEKRGDNRGAMIAHVDPVAHIHPVAINRERLVAERLDDHERN